MSLQNSSVRRFGRHWCLAVGLSLLGLAACYPGGPETATDTDVVVTVEVPEADFANLLTYYLDEEVYDLTPPDQDVITIPQDTKDRIIEFLHAGMAAAGFDSVAEDANPQLVMVSGAVVSEVWFYYYGWGGYYPPGWYYPPYYYQTGSFELGSVVWQLLDQRSNPPPDEPDPIWIAGLNGVLSNSTTTDFARLQANINQAFAQSPYIQATPATR